MRFICFLLLFTSCVTEVHQPPAGALSKKSTIANQEIGEGGTLSIIDAGDLGQDFPNNQEITYECYYDSTVDASVELENYCYDLEGANFDEELGILYWSPNYDLGNVSYEFLIYATDGNLQVEEIFTVTVSNTNRAPQLTYPAAETYNENAPIEIDINDENTYDDIDIDGDSLTYSCYFVTSSGNFQNCSVLGVDLNSFDGIFEWTPSFSQAGEYQFVVFATDGQLSDSARFNLTIKDVNRVPSISSVDDQIIYETESLVEIDVNSIVTGNDLDLDGDKLVYSCYYDKVDDGTVSETYSCRDYHISFDESTGKLNWTPDVSSVDAADGSTTYEIKIKASDGEYSDETIFTVNVLDFEYNAYKDVSAGDGHTCVIKDDGMVYCFGRNDRGQLGDDSRVDQVNLQKVDFDYFLAQDKYLGFKKVYASSLYSCALSHKGEAFCWGANDEGQLGNGSTDDSLVPVKVDMSAYSSDTAFKKLALGYEHACGITAKGSMYCWGSNDYGKLGVEDGDSAVRAVYGEQPSGTDFDSYLATIGGYSVSTDSAVSFTNYRSSIYPSILHDFMQDIHFDELSIYVATKQGLVGPSIYTTTNGLASNDVKAVYANGALIYAATSEGLSISINGGDSFTNVTVAEGLGSNDLRDIILYDIDSDGNDDILVATAYGLSISFDGGSSFSNYTTLDGLGSNDVRSVFVLDDIIYVGTSKGLSVSTNGGVSYRNYDIGSDSESNYINAIYAYTTGASTIILLATRNGFYSSYFNTYSFINLGSVMGMESPICYDIYKDSSDNYYVASINGLYTLKNGNPLFSLATNDNGLSFSNDDTEHMSPIDRSLTPVKLNSTPFSGFFFRDVSAGKHHTCGLSNNGEVYCFGDNSLDQIGDATLTKADEPTLVDMSSHSNEYIKSISSGDYFTCGLSSSGKVYCWGDNSKGQFGNNLTSSSHLPQEFDISSFTEDFQIAEIDAGAESICACTASGTGYCWGDDILTPETVDMSDYNYPYLKKVSSGLSHSCAISGAGQVHCWGENSRGQLGDGTTDPASTPTRLDDDFYMASSDIRMQQIVTGKYFSCGLSARGIAYCWGDNSKGQFGNDTTIDSTTPARVNMKEMSSPYFKMLAAGDEHVCGLTAGGETYCWGENSNGQLGIDSTDDSLIPELVVMTSFADVVFDSIYAEANNTCGLTSDGNLYCWGANTYGQIGDNTQDDALTPLQVDMSDHASDNIFIDVAVGGQHVCGVSANHTLYCWGNNTTGQLGNIRDQNDDEVVDIDDGDIPYALKPIMVDTSEYSSFTPIKISAGVDHTCIIDIEGKSYCFGGNTYSQLGNRNDSLQETPDRVFSYSLSNADFLDIAAGNYVSCANNAQGFLWCWGRGYLGQLGSYVSDADIPSLVAMDVYSDRFSSVSIGYDHTCALTETGKVYCWGQNNQGQLGSIIGDRYTPVEINFSED